MGQEQLPVELSGRVFTRRDALEAGVRQGTLRSTRIVRRVAFGVYGPADMPNTVEARARAMVAVAPGGSVLEGVSALREFGIMLPASMERSAQVEILTSWCAWDRQEQWLTTRRTTRPLRRWRDGVLHPAPVFARLGTGPWSEEDLVVVGDQLTRREHPLTTLDDLHRGLEDVGRVRGKSRVRQALELVRPGTDSPRETLLRLVIVGAGFPCPAVNRPILDAAGAFVARPDLSWPEVMVAAEYDGVHHRVSDLQRQQDNARLRAMRHAGWTVEIATAVDLARPERFLTALAESLAAGGLYGAA